MKSEHLPSLRLEEIATREHQASEPGIAEHLERCALCAQRLRDMQAEDAAFLVARPPAPFFAGLAEGRRMRFRLLGSLGGLAAAFASVAAVAILLVVALPNQAHHAEEDAIALRGGSSLHVFVVEQDVLVPSSAATVPVGTRLRLSVQLSREGRVCLFHTGDGEHFGLLHGPEKVGTKAWLVPGTFALTPTLGRDVIVTAVLDEERGCDSLVEPLRDAELFAGGDAAATHEGPWRELLITTLPRVAP